MSRVLCQVSFTWFRNKNRKDKRLFHGTEIRTERTRLANPSVVATPHPYDVALSLSVAEDRRALEPIVV